MSDHLPVICVIIFLVVQLLFGLFLAHQACGCMGCQFRGIILWTPANQFTFLLRGWRGALVPLTHEDFRAPSEMKMFKILFQLSFAA